MTNALYTAQAHVVGGRIDGHGRSSDGELEVDLRVPTELGGKGGGTNPEELFAVGYAACFEGALATVARRRDEDASDVAIDSSVMLIAGAVLYAIGQPANVSVNEVLIRPSAQVG